MSKKPPYAELVAHAERAVQGVTDAELRRVAFEKVLDDLLLESGAGSTKQSPMPQKKTKASKKPGGAPRGPKAYIREMMTDGFFRKPKTIAQVKAELENRGHHIALTSLSGPLQKLCQARELRRQKKKLGNKEAYVYAEW